MKKLYRNIAMLSVAGFLFTATVPAQAQNQGQGRPPGGGQGGGRGGFDPAQMQERMMERYREMFKISDDDEWGIISERITAVSSARREAGTGFGGFGRGGRGGRGGAQGGGGGRGGDRPGAAETDALRKAIDEGASATVVKEKLAAVRKVRAAGQAKLVKAQKDLKEVLNVNQEATAVMAGLIP